MQTQFLNDPHYRVPRSIELVVVWQVMPTAKRHYVDATATKTPEESQT
jgi:hypothetical protein